MDETKTCVTCKHFNVFFGEEDWSEDTPGQTCIISCSKSIFTSVFGKEDCNDRFFGVIQIGKNCKEHVMRTINEI